MWPVFAATSYDLRPEVGMGHLEWLFIVAFTYDKSLEHIKH